MREEKGKRLTGHGFLEASIVKECVLRVVENSTQVAEVMMKECVE